MLREMADIFKLQKSYETQKIHCVRLCRVSLCYSRW